MTPISLAVAITLCVLTCDAQLYLENVSALDEQLYISIMTTDYEYAATKFKEYEKENKGDITSTVVHRLIENSKRYAVDFAYHLWVKDEKDIVKKYFPDQFRLIFDQNDVKLVNRRDGLPLKLGEDQDSSNDRTAYGDGKHEPSRNVAWRFIPVWENDRAYYKIYNVHYNQYLKLGVAEDGVGDHKVYGDDKAETFRHQWYIVPIKYKGDVLFFVYNREYNKALKLSRNVNESQDRQAWGHSGHVVGNPELFAWDITPYLFTGPI